MMDWKLLWSTFVLLFVAELGDKTQLAVICTSASSGCPWTVFLGATLALITVTLIGTLAGQVIARFVSPDLLRKGAGGLFALMGVLMFFDKI
jgi:putative Ca2+/H+ antiporter (TMEM165/GDT1 family)